MMSARAIATPSVVKMMTLIAELPSFPAPIMKPTEIVLSLPV